MPPRDQRSLALGRPLTPLSTEFLCGLWFSRGVFSATDATLGGAWGVPTPRDTCLARAARHWVRRGDGGPPGDRTPNPRIKREWVSRSLCSELLIHERVRATYAHEAHRYDSVSWHRAWYEPSSSLGSSADLTSKNHEFLAAC